MYLDLFQQFGTAVALSFLIGLEREQNKQSLGNITFAGIRSFMFIGLLGALAFYFLQTSVVLFSLITAVVFALLVAAYVVVGIKTSKIGITTEVAAIVTYIIGGLCVTGNYVFAVCLTITILAILYFKGPIHRWAGSVNRDEIISTIKFMIIAFVVLPLLPNHGYGPYEVFNPYVIWLMVVFISGISFLSYIAIKLIGPRRGIGVTGFLAGLISSTALSMSFSRESKENKSIINPYVFAVVVASTAMYLRVFLEIYVLNKEMVRFAMVPLFSMAFVGIVSALVLWIWKDGGAKNRLSEKAYKLKSPFRLKPAIQFGLFFAIILFISKLGYIYFGQSGVYLVSLISGVVDMDAITVSMAKLGGGETMSYSTAVTAITLASISNTIFKGGLFVIFGSRKSAKRLSFVFFLMIVAGILSLLFV